MKHAKIDVLTLMRGVNDVGSAVAHCLFQARYTKVIEVDPRIRDAQVFGIGERPARIAEGVLTAIQHWEANHVH